MSRALFVSDIHISSASDEKAALFLRVLDRSFEQQFDHLFLVGDIFDLWIANRSHFVEEYKTVIEKLRWLHAAGMQIHYFEGNHDLDLHPFWQKTMGFNVYSEPAYFQLNGLVIRVEHGDQMDPEDRGYLFLRWLLRTRPMVILGRCLPNWAVKWIGRRASAKSRVYTSCVKTASDEQVRGKIRAHARRAYSERPFDLLVSGHVHVVENSTEEINGKKFAVINLGTWLKVPVVMDLEGQRVHLKGADLF